MNVRHLLILTSSLFFLSGCSSLGGIFGNKSPKPIEVKTVEVDRTKLNLSPPPPLNSSPVEWIIITPENADEVWSKLKEKNVDVVIIGLTDDEYQKLALSLVELRNIISQQRLIILKYKEYYESSNSSSK